MCLAVRSYQKVYVFKMASKLSKACNYWMKRIPLCTFTTVSTSVQVALHPLWLCLSPPILKVTPFSLEKSLLSLLLGGTYSWVWICACLQHSAVYFAFPFWKETCQGTAANPDCSLSTCSLFLLVQHCFFIYKLLHSEGKYFSALQAFTARTSIYAILCTFLFLSHRMHLNSIKELTLNYAFKPTL